MAGGARGTHQAPLILMNGRFGASSVDAEGVGFLCLNTMKGIG